MKLLSYVITISVLFASIGQVGSDLYLPSLPAIAMALHTTTHLVQATVFLYMVGFSASRLIYGPVSDAVGRRKPLLTGLLFCLFGTIVCLFANSIALLMIGRLLQGLGAGAGVVLAGAIVRDLLEGNQLAKTYSYTALVNIVLIACAPLIGGYLQLLFGWQASFVFIALYLLMALYVGTVHLKETNRHRTIENLRFKKIALNLAILFSSRTFVGYGMTIFFIYGSILAWLTLGPILLENTLKISPVGFGWVAAAGGVFYAAGALLNTKLIDRYGINRMLKIAGYVLFLAGLLTLLFWLLGVVKFWPVIIPVMIMVFSAGIIFPNAFAGALMPFPKIAGIAGAIVGFIQIMGGVIASGVISIVPDNTQLPLAVAFIVCGIGIIFMVRFAAGVKS
ncbi:MAG: multidrug effflux MFS transporter [Gammaproteobacteria bacterium]|nr:multidrug effflux MFS transporter [Gammaproteobacteria bacterium]